MIKRIFVIIMMVLMITSLAVGCAAETDIDANDSLAVSNEDEDKTPDTQKEIDEIVICENHDINTGFTPVFDVYTGWGSFYYLSNFYEALVNYDNGKIVPGLAKSWEVNGNEIIFKLREDVKFTDGTDFNAQVVKKNFDMIPKIMVKEYVESVALLTKIEEVKVIDEYTVKIILTDPYYAALQELTAVRPMGMMSLNAYTEEGLSEEVFSKTFGTGKYMIENAVKGGDYTFVRNENYWGDKPKVKQFVVKTIPNLESKIMALRSGEIDMIFGASNITYDAFLEFKDHNKFLAKASQAKVKTRNIIINTTKAPLNDVNVRRAVQYAIDKQSICDSLFSGIEEKADYLFNPDLPYCEHSLEPYTYDVQKSNQLLDEEGWVMAEGSNIREKNGEKLEVDILFNGGIAIENDLALTIATYLEKVGFSVNLTGLDHMAASGQALSGDFSMFLTLTYGIPYEPHTDISNMEAGGWYQLAQKGLTQKQDIDFKINELSSLVEEDMIHKSYNYILKTLHNEAAYLPISYRKQLVILNKEKIKDYKFNGQPLNIDISGVIPNN